ncbi:MAG: leucine-rich repeat protein, partial [Clostridia bacterium]|nr:leucine-rich repeat protein [Clostridia bacterium]
MRSEMNFKDQRLLEALDNLDPEFIDEALDVMRIPPANPSPERDRRTTLLSVKLVIALAASLLIIGACIPALSLIIRHYLISPGGTLGSDTEETTLCESETEETTTTETTTETAPVTSGDFEYRLRDDGTLAVFYKGEAEEVTVPSEIDGKTVTAIGEGAFWLSRVKKVTLPDTITLIDRDAFSQSGVEEINLPASLREIGSCAFQECHSLVNIELNEGLRVIGSYAFMNISAERIEIPASVESIGGGAFASCWQLGELILDPNNQTYTASGNCIIEKSTKTLVVGFGECVIPSDGSVTSIGEGALGGTPITSLVIPDSVTEIGARAFIYCSQLKRVSIPATLQSLGEGAFYECKALESISLPYGIKSIGDSTFRGCINLKTASIPYGIESIGEYAFSNCASLTEIYVPESTRTIGRNAFEFCASLCEITIPNSVKVIPDNTFYGCLKLERAQIGFGTTSIGTYAFGKCPILKKFVFKDLASAWYEVEKGNNWHYASGFTSVQCNDGVVPLTSEQLDNGTPGLLYMINPDGKSASLVSVGDCRETEITVASSYNGYPVTTIGDSVFIDQNKLKSVTIPDTVTEIGYAAFSLCTSLTSIRIPESMTTIGGYAFSMCTSLSEIGLPAGITYIGRDAFTSCPIKEINLGDALESIEAEVFMNCTKLERIALPRSVRSIDLRAFKSCTALESFNFEGSVAEWKAIERDKTWKEYCSFIYVHCSDGNIEADIMTADVAKQLAADYLGIIIGSKDPETGYRRVFWVKKEPTAASPIYLIAVSHEV